MLRASAVLLSGGAAGALTTHSLTDSARAQSETQLAVTGDDVVVRGGTIAAVWLDLSVEWAYAVPSGEQPDHVEVAVLAGTDSGALTELDSATSSEAFLEASGSEQFEVDLLGAVLDADALVPSEPGTVAETTVYVGAEMRLVDSADMVIAADSQTTTATLTVELSDYDPSEHGAVGGVGNVTIAIE